jgi:hypothetical protein
MSKAVHDIAEKRHSVWVSLAAVSKHLNVQDAEMLEGAMSHGIGKGWLKVGGKPVHSLMLTDLGEKAVLTKK